MNIRELKEKRAKLVADANALLTAAEGVMAPDVETRFNEQMDEAEAIRRNIDAAERGAAAEAELRATVKPEGQNPGAAAVGTEEQRAEAYKKAFRSYLIHGKEDMSREERALLAEKRVQSDTTGAGGAYLIPQGFQKELETALKFYGGMRQVSRSLTTDTGNTLPWPTNNDTSNAGALLSDVGGVAPENDLVFGQVSFGAYTYTSKAITVPNELLQDSAFDLQEYIKERFVERIGRIQNTHFTTRATNPGPQGVVVGAVAGGAGVVAAAGGTSAITYNNLVDTTRALDKAYRDQGVWMLNDLTFSVIRKIVDGYGRPLLSPGIDGSDPDKILGFKYVINNDMATPAANAVSMLFGNFQKYVIRDVANSMAILRLDQINALSNQTTFVAFTRADGRLIDAGTHPIVTFTQSAT
jgi:HK97 family phage major capsid protein